MLITLRANDVTLSPRPRFPCLKKLIHGCLVHFLKTANTRSCSQRSFTLEKKSQLHIIEKNMSRNMSPK